jgi:hypothetical protein
VLFPIPTEPMTPEGWQVVGCSLTALGLGMVALGLYPLTRGDADRQAAVTVLATGVGLIVLPQAIRWLVGRWVG